MNLVSARKYLVINRVNHFTERRADFLLVRQFNLFMGNGGLAIYIYIYIYIYFIYIYLYPQRLNKFSARVD